MSHLRSILTTALAGALGIGALYLTGGTNAQDAASKPLPSPTATPVVIDDDDIVKIDTNVVNVLFTVQDKNRRMVTDLKESEVQVLENGQAQEISAFAKQVDLPLSLAILIDTSLSQEQTLPDEKSAAISFLESVVRPSKDEVAVISFTGDPTLEQGMTNNITRLRRAIDRVQFVAPSNYIGGGVVANGGGIPGTPPISGDNQMRAAATAMWDAIWVTSEEILGPAPEKTRRAIILLTDGDDTFSRKRLDDAVNAANKAEAIIYSIGIGGGYRYSVDKGALTKVSERTGGRAYFPRDERELRDAFRQIEEDMRSQYLVAYEPSNQKRDGSYRTINVKITNPQREKIKVTHRQGYFAENEGTPAPKK